MRIKPWAAVAAAVPLAAGCVSGPPAVPASQARPSAASGPSGASAASSGASAASGASDASGASSGVSGALAAKPPQVPAGTTAAWVVFDRQAGGGGRVVATRNAHRAFRSASVVKILLAVDYLESRATVPPADARLLKIMLRSSDDDAASTLWDRAGKGAVITRMARRLGLSDTVPPPASKPGFWGYTSLSAYDVVRVYRYLLDRAAPRVRDTILGHLRAATPCGTDGFDQYFGIPRAVPRPWAVKQGWSGFGTVPPVRCRPGSASTGAVSTGSAATGAGGTQGASISAVALRARGSGVPDLGRPVLHTTGLAGKGDRYVLAVLTAHPAGGTWSASVRRITTLTAELYRGLR
ncbi:hypothetical protein [Nonomuraea rhodomycinica]|uniref:Beta-lactamase enzyme family protein n=1 Tax=Nonomuraea rhodomycinica TaxID=1712872 RepID=A0A7Y6IIV3_9ACTN|nr:hypothetical protein [Nonomuraea rhodomycinica]NUW38937.1 hypothetical protein [Nonomuraea rhodomycinica]